MNAMSTALRGKVGLGSIFWVFLVAGGISFGGGVVAYLHEYLVRRRSWVNDEEFLTALAIGQTLPGLNSVNISVLVGDKLRGVPGATAAAAGVLLPGILAVLAAGLALQGSYEIPVVRQFLLGVAAAAVGLLTAVMLQLGRTTFAHFLDALLVVATFAGVSLLHFPLYAVLLAVSPVAVWLHRPRRDLRPGGGANRAPGTGTRTP